MKIVFLTGSLSRDGVADYAQRLASALEPLGASSRFLSWAEPSLAAPQFSPDSLRLPRNLPLAAKHSHARAFLSDFRPDVLSLQFVPFAFDPRGFPFSLAEELRPLRAFAPFHIFAHELWVLLRSRSALKYRLLGPLIQKPLTLSLFRSLEPRLIHAALPLYLELLRTNGFPAARELPLFGNIPLEPLPPRPLPPHARHLGFFGAIAPSAPLEDFFAHCAALQEETGLAFTLSSGGSLAEPLQRRWQALARRYAGTLHVERLGFLAPREASYYLSSLDLFLSGYSPSSWQKSGAIAAAREHGLATVLLSPPEARTSAPLPADLFPALTPELLLRPPPRTPANLLPSVAERFLRDLRQAFPAATP